MADQLELKMDKDQLKLLHHWIVERETVRLKKEAGLPKPWTEDTAIRDYRYCNVRREDDAVTRWISTHWRTPNADHHDLWFAMAVARYLNAPETLEILGFPCPWKPKELRDTADGLRFNNRKVFNGAYIISTGGQRREKVDYLISFFSELWTRRFDLRPKRGQTLAEYHDILTSMKGIGHFMAAQIIADMKYVKPLSEADDWTTFARPGPGSRRGLNIIYGRPTQTVWNVEDWHHHLLKLQVVVNTALGSTLIKVYPNTRLTGQNGRIGQLHAQDLQNCLCELSKYHKVILGTGRPKSIYPGT